MKFRSRIKRMSEVRGFRYLLEGFICQAQRLGYGLGMSLDSAVEFLAKKIDDHDLSILVKEINDLKIDPELRFDESQL